MAFTFIHRHFILALYSALGETRHDFAIGHAQHGYSIHPEIKPNCTVPYYSIDFITMLSMLIKVWYVLALFAWQFYFNHVP